MFSLDNRLPGHCLPAESELQVLQIVREALANVVRHSHARQVWIRLWPSTDGGVVEVCDDGVGLPQYLPSSGHFGLHIMRERAAAIGAELRIEPASTGGTRGSNHGFPRPTSWRCSAMSSRKPKSSKGAVVACPVAQLCFPSSLSARPKMP